MQRLFFIVFLVFPLMFSSQLYAKGVLRDGNSAEAIATGGTNTASADDPIDAMTGNPAGLSLIDDSSIQFGITAPILDAEFSNPANPGGVDADTPVYPIPDLAYAHRVGRITFGLGLNPVAVAEGDWRYVDTPGGLTGVTSYGLGKYRSKFVALRGSAGLAAEVAPGIHLGTSLGVVYNETTLQIPYVFQTQPVLRTLKTRMSLKTDGIGYNASFGAMLQPRSDVKIGLLYTTPTVIDTEGSVSGNAGLDSGGLIGDYRYDAEAEMALPAIASLGVEWQADPDLRLLAQIDWVNWSDAFDDLTVNLDNGNNVVLNTLLGSDGMTDVSPLGWKDRVVFRVGGDYRLTEKTTLRAGYSYGESPVPSSTLTPLTATIAEHTIGLGIGHRLGDYRFDFGYQWDLPAEQHVGQSALLTGEYNNSDIETSTHWLTLSISLARPFR